MKIRRVAFEGMMGKCLATNKFHWTILQFGCQKKRNQFSRKEHYMMI